MDAASKAHPSLARFVARADANHDGTLSMDEVKDERGTLHNVVLDRYSSVPTRSESGA